MVLRGFLAGAYIAMGGALATVCSTGIQVDGTTALPASSTCQLRCVGAIQRILGAMFPVQLIITVLTGAELFTGDAMLAPMAAVIHKISWADCPEPVDLGVHRKPDRFHLLGVHHGLRSV